MICSSSASGEVGLIQITDKPHHFLFVIALNIATYHFPVGIVIKLWQLHFDNFLFLDNHYMVQKISLNIIRGCARNLLIICDSDIKQL